MTFRSVGNVDPDYNKGLILSNSDDNEPLVWTGFALTGSQPAAVAIVDASGDQITSFGGGTQYAELATTAPGTGTLALGRYKSSSPTLTDGQMYGLQLDSTGALRVTGGSSGTQYATNTAYADGNIGTLALTIRDDALSALTEADGDYSGLRVTSVGRLWTSAVIDTALPAGTAAIGGITLAGTNAQWKDDANYGEDVTSGVGTVSARLWDGAAYDRWPGDSTNGALVNLGANNDVTIATPTTLVAFVTDIPTAGTRVQLASNAVSGIVITAAAGNTGLVYVGGSLVSSTVYGMQLQPGQSVGLAIDNTNRVWVDTATNGNDVAVFGS